MEERKAYISNIQHFSLDDGPGIRTTVFFRGCNLHCAWCHNPECIPAKFVLRYNKAVCIGCGICKSVCPNGCHVIDEEGHSVDRERCTGCGNCIEFCPASALEDNGKEKTSSELMKIILDDADFYASSEGGVTFSGGDPMLQIPFLKLMLTKCREAGIKTAIDTAGNVPRSSFEEVLPYDPLFLFDVKFATSALHQKATGVPNKQILENLHFLCEQGARIWVRVPCIPQFHDEEELKKIADLLKGLPLERIELLPYHKYGVGKYDSMELQYGVSCEAPKRDWMEKIGSFFEGAKATLVIS